MRARVCSQNHAQHTHTYAFAPALRILCGECARHILQLKHIKINSRVATARALKSIISCCCRARTSLVSSSSSSSLAVSRARDVSERAHTRVSAFFCVAIFCVVVVVAVAHCVCERVSAYTRVCILSAQSTTPHRTRKRTRATAPPARNTCSTRGRGRAPGPGVVVGGDGGGGGGVVVVV